MNEAIEPIPLLNGERKKRREGERKKETERERKGRECEEKKEVRPEIATNWKPKQNVCEAKLS